MEIGYVLNTYPRPSHSFIRREIRALERLGHQVHRFAMRPPPADEPLLDPDDRAEAERTEYILAAGPAGLAAAVLRIGLGHPRRFLRAVLLAMRCGRAGSGARTPGTGGRLRHLVYLAEAAALTLRAGRLGLGHLHAHFGTNAATVAMLAQTLGAPGFSMTVHGPEEFDAPRALALPEKLARAQFAVGVSSFGRSQLSRWAPAALWDRLHVVRCGIEPDRFPDPAPLPPGRGQLVAIGRLAEQKGHLMLPAALKRALSEAPELRVTLIGDGPLRGTIERAAAKAGVADNLTLAGWQDEAGVREALAAAHALILPSLAEGLPMVVMEAMAAGRPVIATAIAGIPELVRPGETGWLVPPGDTDALARAMIELHDAEPDRLARMGAAGRSLVLERHDARAEAARLAGLFGAQDPQTEGDRT
ncbi:MAG: glycosyltransferase [Gemmobacter sp.]